MKLFIKKNFYFICFILLSYAFLCLFWGAVLPQKNCKNLNFQMGSYGHMYSRTEEIHNFKNVDILFLGSSHAYRGFDPRIFSEFGFRSFNLGSSSQTPVQTEILLDLYLKELNPKLIIYEVYPATLSSDGIESALDLIANAKLHISTFKMIIKLNHIKLYNTFLYKIVRTIFGMDDAFNSMIQFSLFDMWGRKMLK